MARQSSLSNMIERPPEMEPPARITVASRKRTRLIELRDIRWIRAAGDYVELHTRGATYVVREQLSALLKRLPSGMFSRIHRSYAVNLSEVSQFTTLRNQNLLVELKDGTILRSSRTFSKEFLRALT